MKENERETSNRIMVRERIMRQALDSFAVHGIKSVRMDDIANALKISKRTLYELFVDKETLLTECLLYHKKKSDAVLKEIVAKSTNVLEVILICYQESIEMYHKMNKAFFEDIKKYPRAHMQLRAEKEKDQEQSINFFKQGVAQGIFRDDINFSIMQLMLREQMKMLMETDVWKQHHILEVYETMVFVYLRGISTQKGAMELEEFIKGYREKKNEERNNENQDN
ncbi:TetR/AcrR family transcriptional regulator [Bacteroides sp. OttesenSCG-928-J23]|nr:TetR/AcrR family transcriptional regulator [Bacteroides sp. OttesenSCG-928-J23]